MARQATGDAYTQPAPDTTDVVMAMDMDTGKVRWSVLDTENDAWLVGCAQDPSENCPKNLGPDFDFGASPILHSQPGGRRLLLAGQKSGQVFAHDPDRQGAVRWKATLADPLGSAEILFGGAADDDTAYFGLSSGVLTALDAATGKQKWSTQVVSPSPVVAPARSGGGRNGTAALTPAHRTFQAGLDASGQSLTSVRWATGSGWGYTGGIMWPVRAGALARSPCRVRM